MSRFRALGGVATIVAVLLASSTVAPAAARAIGSGWVMCEADASVRLFADQAHTSLVDWFSVSRVPTQHRIGSGYFVIKDDQASPGVNVVGQLTGKPYVCWYQGNGIYVRTDHTAINNASMHWRVQEPGAGFVADSRYRKIEVWRDSDQVVSQVFGPVNRNLWLSGGIFISCPVF